MLRIAALIVLALGYAKFVMPAVLFFASRNSNRPSGQVWVCMASTLSQVGFNGLIIS